MHGGQEAEQAEDASMECEFVQDSAPVHHIEERLLFASEQAPQPRAPSAPMVTGYAFRL